MKRKNLGKTKTKSRSHLLVRQRNIQQFLRSIVQRIKTDVGKSSRLRQESTLAVPRHLGAPQSVVGVPPSVLHAGGRQVPANKARGKNGVPKSSFVLLPCLCQGHSMLLLPSLRMC